MDFYTLGVKAAAPMPGPMNPYASNPGQMFKDLGTLTGMKFPPIPSKGPAPPPAPAKPPAASAAPAPQQPPQNTAAQSIRESPAAGASTAQFGLGMAGKVPARMMGQNAPEWLRSFSNYQPGRTWGQYAKELIAPTTKAYGDDAARGLGTQLASRVGGGKLMSSLLPKSVSTAAKAGGPIATPINAGMEVMDAAGALPQWAGGTGLGHVGWAPDQDFEHDTTMGQAGDNMFGYKGPGWQGLNYLGAGMNSWSKPLRSIYNLGESAVEAPYRFGNEFFRGRRLDQARQQAQRGA